MRARWVMAIVAAAALAAPATVLGGGFATVGVSSTPDGTGPNEPWAVDLEVLQHGRTPLSGVKPTITIRNGQGTTRVFDAQPTSKKGVYRATVVFPKSGRWSYEINDGFSQTHTYPPVTIGEGGGATATPAVTRTVEGGGGGDDGPWLALAAALAVGLAVAGGVLALGRRRRGAARPALSDG